MEAVSIECYFKALNYERRKEKGCQKKNYQKRNFNSTLSKKEKNKGFFFFLKKKKGNMFLKRKKSIEMKHLKVQKLKKVLVE